MSKGFKLIANGHILEVYEYEREVLTGVKKGGRKSKDDEEISDRKEEIRRTSSVKARNEVRRKIMANFSEHSKFWTFTFRDTDKFDITNVQECNYQFKKAIQRIKYKYGNFKYIAVIEYQDKNDRGAVHYHMICDLPYIKHEEMQNKLWKYGHCFVNDINHVDNVGAYVIKYMIKDVYDERLEGQKSYLCSQGLNKSVIIRGNIVEDILKQYGIDENTKKVFTSHYESEHNGTITYKEYNLKRN
jgi:hypothetical protein